MITYTCALSRRLLGTAAVGLASATYDLVSLLTLRFVWHPLVQRPDFGRSTAFLVAVPLQMLWCVMYIVWVMVYTPLMDSDTPKSLEPIRR
jgi:hypothetical protein